MSASGYAFHCVCTQLFFRSRARVVRDNYFSVNTGAHQECVLVPTPFNSSTDHVFGRMSGWSVSFEIVRITELDFADSAVIFAELTEVFAEAPLSQSLRVVRMWKPRRRRRQRRRVPSALSDLDQSGVRLCAFGSNRLRKFFGENELGGSAPYIPLCHVAIAEGRLKKAIVRHKF